MKKYLIFFLFIFLSSCSFNKYPSKTQAKGACEKWVSNGGIYILNTPEYLENNPPSTWGNSYLLTKKSFKINTRFCKKELETKQYLGYQKSIKENTILNSPNYCPAKFDFQVDYCARDPKGTEYFIKKHFYY